MPAKKNTGFLLFTSKMRIEAISYLQSQHIVPTNSIIIRELSAMWNSLTHDEQLSWNHVAALS